MRVIIIGGGVAGLATAIALREQGLDVHVVERRDGPTQLGAGVVCWPNASFVLAQLGLLERLLAVGGAVSSMRRMTATGRVLGDLDVSAVDSAMGWPSVAVLRRDLMGILRGRLQELDGRVTYANGAVGISESDEDAWVTLADGTEAHGDVIIGADGRMASVARLHVLGRNAPRFQRFVNWIGVYEGSVRRFEPGVVLDVWGLGERFGLVPLSPTACYWAGGAAVDVAEADPGGGQRAELVRRFGGWPGPIPDLVRDASSFRIAVHDHDPIDTWHNGRVLLIGDAAHAPLPTSGQGACQALEDAWHLAQLLPGCHDVEAAFTEFVARRASKTGAITRIGRDLARQLFPMDPSRCADRDERAALLDYTAMASGVASAWGAGLPLG